MNKNKIYEVMTTENKEKDAKARLRNMGIDKTARDKLLGHQRRDGSYLYDSAFKITSLSEKDFMAQLKERGFTQVKAKEIYQKALARKHFIARYMANRKSLSEPHYNALRSSKKKQ